MAQDENIIFTRLYLKATHEDVKAAGIAHPMKAARVHKTLNTWEFHGPDGFYWYGSAYNAYEARAKGWDAWLAKFHPEVGA